MDLGVEMLAHVCEESVLCLLLHIRTHTHAPHDKNTTKTRYMGQGFGSLSPFRMKCVACVSFLAQYLLSTPHQK